jgi:RNA polymerase sigma-70 factor (ECF subfamily)
MAPTDLPPERLNDWLTRGAQGDEAACAALHAHFSPAVLRLCLGLLGSVADAEEVAQDTFVYALRELRRYDPARSAFGTWLFTIALSRCRNKRRRRWLASGPLELLAGRARPGGGAGPDRQLEQLRERRGIRRQMWAALQALPPRLRDAVALRYLAELRYKEVGGALGCSPKTAESRVRLGLATMRRTLLAWGVEPEAELAEQWG